MTGERFGGVARDLNAARLRLVELEDQTPTLRSHASLRAGGDEADRAALYCHNRAVYELRRACDQLAAQLVAEHRARNRAEPQPVTSAAATSGEDRGRCPEAGS